MPSRWRWLGRPSPAGVAILWKGRIEEVHVVRLPKPEFSFEGHIWADERFLPELLVTQLRELLPKPPAMSADGANRFLACCAIEVQWRCAERVFTTPARQIQEELNSVATKARALLHALSAMDAGTVSTFGAHWDFLAFGSSPPVELSDDAMKYRSAEGRFLGAAWDLVSDLEASAQYAIKQCKPSRQAQSSVLRARDLVKALACEYRGITGTLPPYSKTTWFPDFMETLCAWEKLDLKCGRALVESAIRSITPIDGVIS